jgi:flagellar hook-length control protein FliK
MRGELHAGKNEFRLVLDPPDMGRLDVNVVARGDGVVLRLHAERADVAQWLRSDLPVLHRAIEKDGLQVLGVEVRSWTGFDAHGRSDHHREAASFADDRDATFQARGPKAASSPSFRAKTSARKSSGIDLIL